MSSYYSNVLRDLAVWLEERPDDVILTKSIWISILNSVASHIDEQQFQVGARTEQIARLMEKNNAR